MKNKKQFEILIQIDGQKYINSYKAESVEEAETMAYIDFNEELEDCTAVELSECWDSAKNYSVYKDEFGGTWKRFNDDTAEELTYQPGAMCFLN